MTVFFVGIVLKFSLCLHSIQIVNMVSIPSSPLVPHICAKILDQHWFR